MKKSIDTILKYLKAFLKWTLIAIIIGALCGVVGAFFHHLLDYVTHFRSENSYIICFLPISGLLIALLYSFAKKQGKINTDRVIKSVGKDGDVPFVTVPLIFISTIITHLFGGSAGREGAALQIGGGIGYNFGKMFKMSQNDKNIITMAGMGSVFSALFSTPVAAAVFAIEVAKVGIFNATSFLPCIIASITAYFVSLLLGVTPLNIGTILFDNITVLFSLKVAILSIICALIGIVFCIALRKSSQYQKKLIPNPYLRIFIGGAVIVLLTCLVGTYDYNGAGMDVIYKALSGDARSYDFILKILFTAITIGAGFKGGEIVPAFFTGATLGCVVSPYLGIGAALGAAIGMIALFCATVNCPIASIVLAVELFGGEGILVFALASAVSYIMSGHFSLYKEQHFVYSKLTADLYDK